MIEKIESVAAASDVLTSKLNEVIEVVNRRHVDLTSRRPPTPGPAQHVQYLETMSERLATGPYKSLSETEPNELTKAIGEALTKFQEAVKEYKASLIVPE